MVPLLPVDGVPSWFLRWGHWWHVQVCNRRRSHRPTWVIERSIIVCDRCGQILDANPDARRYNIVEELPDDQ